jgi:hypothetical protein
MTALAPSLAAFLREHLPRDRRASPHTCEAYAYSFQLLVTFAAKRLRMRPCQLAIEHLDVPMILAFLLVWTAPDGIERARMRSLQISDKGDRPWTRLAELGWIRRSTFSSFTE